MFPNQRAVASGNDDKPLYAIYKDFSGGINTRIAPKDIGNNQAVSLTNWDIGTPATLLKTYGSVEIGSLPSTALNVVGIHNFDIQGATDQLLAYTNNNIYKWIGSGAFAQLSYASLISGSTFAGFCAAKESGLSPDDIALVYNGVNNVLRIDASGNYQDLGDTNTSPPLTDVMCWYGNRVWGLKNDILYFSDAYDSDYSGAFDRTTNWYRIPVGEERGLVATRDMGIVCLGKDAVWAIAPSVTPAATDKPEPLVPNLGCVSKRGFETIGDDIYFFSQEGLVAVKRNIQDKLQLGASYSISYMLKEELESVSWANISNLSMKYFDNKLFIGVPTSASTFDTWIYYPATNGFTKKTGLHPLCWAVYKVSNKDQLYYGRLGKGSVYQAWNGYTDEGTTTTNGTAQQAEVETRYEEFGQPLTKKVGGEVEVIASSSSGSSLTVSAKVDEGTYTTIGTVSLTSASDVTLPVDLPFTIYDTVLIRDKFHLDEFGEFRGVQVKVVNSDSNTDDIKLHNINVVAFPQEYENE